jgi:hypothetical protein
LLAKAVAGFSHPHFSEQGEVSLAFSRIAPIGCAFFADTKAVAGFAPHRHLRKQPLYRAHLSQQLEVASTSRAHHANP